MKIFISQSALPISQYRPFHKLSTSDKSHLIYNDLFKKESGNSKAWRLYYNLDESKHSTAIVPLEVREQLKEAGLELEDYVKGLATDKHGRSVKIGKFLKGTALRLFEKDPKRLAAKKQGNLLVVISRHPYDVIGSSTGRSWVSCLNLDTGVNKKYVAEDIKHGTLVAYLVVNTDKNINHPIARTRLIRYFNEKNQKEYILVPDGTSYGANHKKFNSFIKKWCKNTASSQLGTYFKTQVYTDDSEDSKKQYPRQWTDTKDFPEEKPRSFYVYNPESVPNLSIKNIKQQNIVLSVPKEANLNWWIGYTKALLYSVERSLWKIDPKILLVYKNLAPLDKIEEKVKFEGTASLYFQLLKKAIEENNIKVFDVYSWILDDFELSDIQSDILANSVEGYVLEKFDYDRLTDKQFLKFRHIWLHNLKDVKRCNRLKIDVNSSNDKGNRLNFYVKYINTCKGFEKDMLRLFITAEEYLTSTFANDDVFCELINYDKITDPPLSLIDKKSLWKRLLGRIHEFLMNTGGRPQTYEERRAEEMLRFYKYVGIIRRAEEKYPDVDQDVEDIELR